MNTKFPPRVFVRQGGTPDMGGAVGVNYHRVFVKDKEYLSMDEHNHLISHATEVNRNLANHNADLEKRLRIAKEALEWYVKYMHMDNRVEALDALSALESAAVEKGGVND